jgi:peptidoglycan/LPS O-acetylase OafA/YrhL
VLYHTAPLPLRVNGVLPIGNFINISFISVGFFFTLSGYILSSVYLRAGRPVEPKRFWIARFARIYPLFAVSLLLDLPYIFLFRLAKYGLKAALWKTAVTLAGNLVMLQSWILQLRFLNTPVWSLGVETIFYLAFPFIGWRLWKASPRAAVWGSVLLYFSGMALVAAGTRLHLNPDVIKFNPIFHMHEFLIGILVARWHLQKLEHAPAKNTLKRLAPWMAVLALAIFVVAIYQFTRIPQLYLRDGLLLPAYVLAIIAFGTGNRWLDAAFSIPALVVLGEASYGLYLIHQPIAHYFGFAGLTQSLWIYPIYLALTVALSVVGFYLFENRARQAILHWAHTRSKETTMTAAIAQ